MSEDRQFDPDLVLALGSSASTVLPLIARCASDGPESPVLVGLTAYYPPIDLDPPWRGLVYDLGFFGNPDEVFNWCRRAEEQDAGDVSNWVDPVEDRRLNPTQCRSLYRFHESHGLLSVFWRSLLSKQVGSVHLVTRLCDGAAFLIPEIMSALTACMGQSGLLHVHAILPPPGGVRTTLSQTDRCWAGVALRRLQRWTSKTPGSRRLVWLLRRAHGHGNDDALLERIARLLERVTTGNRPDPLLKYCRDLRHLGAWRDETTSVWGSYRCFANSQEAPGADESDMDDWLGSRLPASRCDLLRRLLIDWGVAPGRRQAVLAADPGLQLIDASNGRRDSQDGLLYQAWLGFLPEEFPDLNDLLAAAGDEQPKR